MEASELVRRRLAAQRLTADPFDRADEVVRWLGAVQAQLFDEAKWSVAERTRSCTDADVEAAFARGELVRTHVLRPTWHFVAAADLRWLLRLTRPRVHALNRYYNAQHGLDAGLLSRAERLLAGALADGELLTRSELAARLAAGGIEAAGPRLAYILMHAELEEVVCSGPRRGKQHTYVLVDRRVPTSPLDTLSRERATAALVLRFFRSHGPATVKEFTAWSSLTAADTREALAGLDSELETSGAVVYERGRPAAPARRAFLIPTYDELRVAPAFERAVVVDGLVVGTWKRSGSTVEVTTEKPLAERQLRSVESAVGRLGRFAGSEVTLELAATIPT